jgi:hypothetical protein
MDKQEFGQLFFSALAQAVLNTETQLQQSVSQSLEIELHGAGEAGTRLSPEEAIEALYIDDLHFYRVIDMAVIESRPAKTCVFVRASAHTPGSLAQTWNQPRGMGPFKQILAKEIRVFGD